MVSALDLTQYLADLLPEVEDYGPNGLQVEGARDIQTLVTGVTASEALIQRAIELKADALLVHHGLFWRGDAYPVTGMFAKRLRPLLAAGIHLYAYHLPLDLHPVYGNNAQLAEQLGWEVQGQFDCVKVKDLACYTHLASPMSADTLTQHVSDVLGRQALCLPGGPEPIEKVAWCTGGAQDGVLDAAANGMHAYITGEASERTTHQAQELGVHVVVAGHHATERYGAQAVGQHLAAHFGLAHHFVDVPNPV